MGVKHLNRFLLKHCSQRAIQSKYDLSNISNQTIAIDISIYLHKFIEDNALLENMYILIHTLQSFSIYPIFVFDGKPPTEKKECLYLRKQSRKETEKKLADIQNSQPYTTEEEQKKWNHQVQYFKRQLIKINDSHIQYAKQIIDAFGLHYIVAEGEADKMCSQLVLNGTAWACLSDDMDMFAYGCPRVMRCLDLTSKYVHLYDLQAILADLNMTMTNFRQLIVMSGTDYNYYQKGNETVFVGMPLETAMNLYYTEYLTSAEKSSIFEWLREIQYPIDVDYLEKVYALFTIQEDTTDRPTCNPYQVPSIMDFTQLYKLLKGEGFIFLNTPMTSCSL